MVNLIVVGKLKNKNLEAVEQDYLKRLKNLKLNIIEIKADAENKNSEARAILKKISDLSKDQNYQLVLLAEKGKEFDSPQFSQWIYKNIEVHKSIFFVIAGAEGHGDEILTLPHQKLSLSKLTFPHKIARIVFVEQFYRAMTIHEGHPYHN